MHCPQCGSDNREGAKFCNECATPLPLRCPSCGTENRPGAKFCNECATPFITPPRTSQSSAFPLQTPNPSSPEAERRQLTVLFCDLVGSTILSERLDPEELREVVRAYQATCAAVIGRFDGYIAQYLGDGLLVYFGYPLAHEDDAARAVRAALSIIRALHESPELNTHSPVPLQVRIGIHTGLVVVGEVGTGGRREQLALGDTPNIAARVQGIAEPDTVVMSASTHRLVHGLFECWDLGPRTLKGVANPLPLYRVLRESDAQSRFEVAIRTGLLPLVGREQEIEMLLQRWEQARAGEGQVVLLSGEAGIGKSRLLQELKERVARAGYTRIEYRCSPYHQNSALYPVIVHLQRLLQLHRDDTPEAKFKKLADTLSGYRFTQTDTVPLFASLLSLPTTHFSLPALTPQRQKQKILEALVAWLLEETERHATLSAWEDLQWADPSTLELLSLIIDQAPTAHMLTLLTFRPDFTPPWTARSHVTSVALSRLARQPVEALVAQIARGKALPAEIVQQVVTKTDGVPLFAEELTKMVLESGLLQEREGHYELTGPLPPLAIPSTLHDSLMARLDRLATVREVAQLAAVLGREFSYELLRSVAPLEEAMLQQALTRLIEAELLYQRGLPPQVKYLFRHAMIQETAYQSLLKSKKQQYHQRIAQVLEEQFPETRETHPELVAHHYTEAGLKEQALVYWQQAGQKAVAHSANVEAISHLTKGLESLTTLPDTPAHIQQKLTFYLTLGPALMATKGYADPEVERVYTQARQLCQQSGKTPELFPALLGLSTFYETVATIQSFSSVDDEHLSR
jgi:class 3 adenylate cyclase